MGEGGSGSSMKAAEHEDERAEATNLFFFRRSHKIFTSRSSPMVFYILLTKFIAVNDALLTKKIILILILCIWSSKKAESTRLFLFCSVALLAINVFAFLCKWFSLFYYWDEHMFVWQRYEALRGS